MNFPQLFTYTMKTMNETERKEQAAHFILNKHIYEEIFAAIERDLTPDFSKDDWLNLMEKSYIHNDTTSIEMLMSLWNSKVNPHMPPNFQIPIGGYDA